MKTHLLQTVLLISVMGLSMPPVTASTYWKKLQGTIRTPNQDIHRGTKGFPPVIWDTQIPAGTSTWVEVRFPKQERLKGIRLTSAPLCCTMPYRIETSRDGRSFILCQSGKWFQGAKTSGAAFKYGDDKAEARVIRITIGPSETDRGIPFSLQDIQVFAGDED
jgi:hypothetical protein